MSSTNGATAARLEPFLQAGWAQLHAAVVRVEGLRILLVGDKGAGKTTLSLRLLYDGHGFEGDELVLTRDGVAMPVARNLHVKPGSRALLPELADGWDALSTIGTDAGDTIRALNPHGTGFPWKILSGPIDLAVVLEAAHGEVTTTRSLPGPELVQQVVPHVTAASASRAALLSALASLLGPVPGHLVRVGELAATVAVVRALRS